MYGRISDPGMGPYYLTPVALAPRTPANQQSASGVGVFTPCGAVSTWGTTVFVLSVCWSYRCMEGFMIGGWNRILPGWHWLMLAPWPEHSPFRTNLLEKPAACAMDLAHG